MWDHLLPRPKKIEHGKTGFTSVSIKVNFSVNGDGTTDLSKKNALRSSTIHCIMNFGKIKYVTPTWKSRLGSTARYKDQMFRESSRKGTFASWPHIHYKWAFPKKIGSTSWFLP